MVDTKPRIVGGHEQSPASARAPGDWLAVVRILLIVQGSIALVSSIESSIAGASQGGVTAPLVVMGLTAAAVTLFCAARIGRLRRRVRKIVVWMQVGWLTMASIDLGLSLVLTQRPFELVPFLTRIVLPLAILRMLRTSEARVLFDVPPSRRQRRKERKSQRIEGRPA